MTITAEQISRVFPYAITGSVTKLVGLTAAVSHFPVPVGAVVQLEREQGSPISAEVVGFSGEETLLLPYGDLQGIRRGTRARLKQSNPSVRVGAGLLGRVINSQGHFLDGLPPAVLPQRRSLHAAPISPLHRPRIDAPLTTGVRAIDGLLTCGKGQRLGIFAGSGVGKSTLMGQIARSTSADVNVVVLIGERGREVREFLEKDLGPAGLARSVVVVATGDEPALLRLRAAYLGTAIAEHFRDEGNDVLLMMDSVTRFALAQREIGLAAGEPPATRGYPPSVFALLPRLLERSGRTGAGSITGFYTVLVEGDDTNEPISDTVRGILDGHVVLSRRLAEQTHFPAIDVLGSISRLMSDLATPDHLQASNAIKQLLSAYRQSEDLISIGAYQAGSNAQVDAAIQLRQPILQFLQQRVEEKSDLAAAVAALTKLGKLREGLRAGGVKADSGA
ncbi:MAG: FliI/YscN family ATPase [Planctomycetaceae bacterium]